LQKVIGVIVLFACLLKSDLVEDVHTVWTGCPWGYSLYFRAKQLVHPFVELHDQNEKLLIRVPHEGMINYCSLNNVMTSNQFVHIIWRQILSDYLNRK
jgi:hypothetical protein